MNTNAIRCPRPLAGWECEDSDTAIISPRADASNVFDFAEEDECGMEPRCCGI
jgi:hypothetical protein